MQSNFNAEVKRSRQYEFSQLFMNTNESKDVAASAYRVTVEAVLATLKSDREHGLSDSEARERLSKFGRNELEAAAHDPWWWKLAAQFADTLVILLLVATAISTALWLMEGESALPYEAFAILGIVLLNAILGYAQESRAEAAVAALRAMSAADATVMRNAQQQRVPAAELVPGDIILIEEGDTIPADARVIGSTSLQTLEAALTGESLPVSKATDSVDEEAEVADRHNMIFSGTAACFGRGQAVVTATGLHTEMGRIASMLKGAPHEVTPLQKELNHVGVLLGVVVVAIAVVIIGTILLIEDIRGLAAVFEALIVGVALAVAAVPEGLPAVVTAVLSLGVQRMAKRKAIVRHLAAVETLGSASVIASDKTGTLTKNQMTVRSVVTASGRIQFSGTGYAPVGELSADGGAAVAGTLREELERALTVARCANNSVLTEQAGQWSIQGDPTEAALIVAAKKAGLDFKKLDARFRRVAEAPFSSERKLMSTVHADAQHDQEVHVFAKGAPDILLQRCTDEYVGNEAIELTDQRRAAIMQSNVELAQQALRTLGVAARRLPADEFREATPSEKLEERLTFLGLIGMIDPPRQEAKQAVDRAKAAGIRPLMITGDHPITAGVIAAELGISSDGRALSGSELTKLSDAELALMVDDVSVYARVNPEHKLRIVKALQVNGSVVAMTGDGVNDAPALKRADIGVAMGITGTDVSKEAADVVLMDDNFATIVAAVEEGRAIFANIRKFMRYLLSSNFGEVLTMFFGILFARVIGLHSDGERLTLPLLATQILWINLVTDGAPALALGLDPADPDVMKQAPRPRGERVLNWQMWTNVVFVGTIMATGTLLMLDVSLPRGLFEGSGDMRYAQTMAFTTLMMFQLFNAFNARSDHRSALSDLFSNRWLWFSVSLSMVLHAAVIYVPFLQRAFSTMPLSLSDWLFCALTASSVLWLSELFKLIGRAKVAVGARTAAHAS